MTPPLTEQEVLGAVAVVVTPQGVSALLSEWLERVVAAGEVAQVIAGSERLQRITAFCRSKQDGAFRVFKTPREASAGRRRPAG
jgi:hypothetical protein